MLPYTHQSDYPVAKVDVLIVNDEGKIVLTKRAVAPFKDQWDIPGGSLEITDFNAEAGAVREIKEELGVEVELTSLAGVYSDPDRDPRYHIVAIIYVGKMIGGAFQLSNHIAEFQWFDAGHIPYNLGFDHARVVQDYIKRRGALRPLRRRIYSEFADKPFPYYDVKFNDRVRLAAGAIILKDGHILLAKRCREPFKGYWYIPGGHILVGETMEECLAREVREELGVACVVKDLFGVYSDRGRDPRNPSCTAYYFTDILSEAFEENFEVNEFRYFPLAEAPELGYHQNVTIEDLKDYLSHTHTI